MITTISIPTNVATTFNYAIKYIHHTTGAGVERTTELSGVGTMPSSSAIADGGTIST